MVLYNYWFGISNFKDCACGESVSCSTRGGRTFVLWRNTGLAARAASDVLNSFAPHFHPLFKREDQSHCPIRSKPEVGSHLIRQSGKAFPPEVHTGHHDVGSPCCNEFNVMIPKSIKARHSAVPLGLLTGDSCHLRFPDRRFTLVTDLTNHVHGPKRGV